MNPADLFVRRSDPIRAVMERIDQTGKGVALVVDDERRLINLITDGDIRRAMLSGVDLAAPVEVLLARKEPTTHPSPFTVPANTPEAKLLHLMNKHTLRHIPLLDDAGHVVAIAFLSDLVKTRELPVRAVVMAGGLGTRLKPLTDKLPKPMLPVSGRPLLERIMSRLKSAGIRRVHVTTYYLKDLITEHFGDGASFGVEIDYLQEHEPRGTAGALGMMEPWTEPLLVINGDILTRVDFEAMLDFHRAHGATMTIGVRQYDLSVPYGVVETKGNNVVKVVEKPLFRHFINAGIYLLSPEVHQYVPRGERCEMPDLINRLVAEGRPVVSFPIFEYWLDIGRAEDYEQGQRDTVAWTT